MDHGAGKLLVGLPDDAGTIRRGIAVAENNLEIAEGDPAPFTVEMRSDGPGHARKPDRAFARELRNEDRQHSHPDPFEAMAEGFPARSQAPLVLVRQSGLHSSRDRRGRRVR